MREVRRVLGVREVLVLALALVVTARLGAQAPAAAEYGRAAKLDVQAFTSTASRIKFEYPKRDWQLVSGGGVALLSLAQKQGQAAIVIERSKLNTVLAPEDITELFGQLEAEAVKDGQPSASDIQSKVVDADGRRVVILTYGRQGVAAPERVRQYSIPIGAALFRIVCSAPAAQFARYEPIFAHVAASFGAENK